MTAILITHDGHTAEIDLPADRDAQTTVMRAVLRTDDLEALYLVGEMDLWCDYAAWDAEHLHKPHNPIATELGGHDVYGAALIASFNAAGLATPLSDAQRTELLARITAIRTNA